LRSQEADDDANNAWAWQLLGGGAEHFCACAIAEFASLLPGKVAQPPWLM